MLAKKDWVRAHIVSQKVRGGARSEAPKRCECLFTKPLIRLFAYPPPLLSTPQVNRKVFLDEGFGELKIRFFTLMVEYFRSQKDAFELCSAYCEMYKTPSVQEDPALWKEVREAVRARSERRRAANTPAEE